jgi:hypothetical protein
VVLDFFYYNNYYGQVINKVTNFKNQKNVGEIDSKKSAHRRLNSFVEQMPQAPWEGRDSGAAVCLKIKYGLLAG